MEGVFAGTIDPGRHAARARSDRCVALGTGGCPSTTNTFGRLVFKGNMEPTSARETQLSAVGMTAEDQIETAFQQFVGDLWGMRQQHGERIGRNFPGRGGQVVGAIKMGVVDASKPEPLTIALDSGGFV